MAKTTKTSGTISINLRLPRTLHRVLVKMAEKQDRSLNGAIVHALKQVADRPS
ncbi:toxin-antitoxin system HicB family antitoxin [Elusimicrobiota bacterium]